MKNNKTPMNDNWSDYYVSDSWVFRVCPNLLREGDCYSVDFKIWMTKTEILDSSELKNHNQEYNGYVKWDGCCNITDSIHLCDSDDMLMWADVIAHVYKVASEHLTSVDYTLSERVKFVDLKIIK